MTPRNLKSIARFKRAVNLIFNNYGLDKTFYYTDIEAKFKSAGINQSYIKYLCDSGVIKRIGDAGYKMSEYKPDSHIKAYTCMSDYMKYINKTKPSAQRLSVQTEIKFKKTIPSIPIKAKKHRTYKKQSFFQKLRKAWRVLTK